MARKRIPVDVQTNVLVHSRRRCCICFGLNRDTSLKAGQIAHIDRNSANSAEDNLAYLCLEHHDEYDSRKSQSKGLTPGEIKRFRKELHNALGKALAIEVHFGENTIPAEDPYAGQFIRVGAEYGSADIKLTPIPDSLEGNPRYAITGFALWGTGREFGPNMGEMSFVGEVVDGVIEHCDTFERQGETHTIRLSFEGERLRVEEENYLGIYGMNVNFIGEYRRVR